MGLELGASFPTENAMTKSIWSASVGLWMTIRPPGWNLLSCAWPNQPFKWGIVSPSWREPTSLCTKPSYKASWEGVQFLAGWHFHFHGGPQIQALQTFHVGRQDRNLLKSRLCHLTLGPCSCRRKPGGHARQHSQEGGWWWHHHGTEKSAKGPFLEPMSVYMASLVVPMWVGFQKVVPNLAPLPSKPGRW